MSFGRYTLTRLRATQSPLPHSLTHLTPLHITHPPTVLAAPQSTTLHSPLTTLQEQIQQRQSSDEHAEAPKEGAAQGEQAAAGALAGGRHEEGQGGQPRAEVQEQEQGRRQGREQGRQGEGLSGCCGCRGQEEVGRRGCGRKQEARRGGEEAGRAGRAHALRQEAQAAPRPPSQEA